MIERESSSFRDPSGFVYKENGTLLRRINECYQSNYELLMQSGLYAELTDKELLITHEETVNDEGYKTIKPQLIPYISYPYEWAFEQYRDAALLTLNIAKVSLEYNMCLKDATAYNIQFLGYKPIFIDTLSFEKYEEDKPWVAYGQFCRHFLAPLALMAYTDIRLSGLMRDYIDGVPLDLAVKLLPKSTCFKMGLYLHLHMHAKQQNRYADSDGKIPRDLKVSKASVLAIIENLILTVSKLKAKHIQTQWADYYKNMLNYSEEAFSEKHTIVKSFLNKCKARKICDMGANEGEFSVLAQVEGEYVIAYDIDPIAVNNHYLNIRQVKNTKVVPLIIDLTNPSPNIGWANNERNTIDKRSNWDCVMALALIHHLAISNNLPLDMIAQYFSTLAKNLIIEFVPKTDSQVEKLLRTRKDIFNNYSIEGFEQAFELYYDIIEKQLICGSERIMYLFKRK